MDTKDLLEEAFESVSDEEMKEVKGGKKIPRNIVNAYYCIWPELMGIVFGRNCYDSWANFEHCHPTDTKSGTCTGR